MLRADTYAADTELGRTHPLKYKYLSVAMSLRHGDRVVVMYTRKSVYRFLRTHVDSMVRTCSPPRLAPFRKYEVAFHRGAITTMMMFDCHPITFYFLDQTDGN